MIFVYLAIGFLIAILTGIAVAVKQHNEYVERGQLILDKLNRDNERWAKESPRRNRKG